MKRAETSLGDPWTTVTLVDMTQEEFDILSALASVKRMIHRNHGAAKYHAIIDGFVYFTPHEGSARLVYPIGECIFVFSGEYEQ